MEERQVNRLVAIKEYNPGEKCKAMAEAELRALEPQQSEYLVEYFGSEIDNKGASGDESVCRLFLEFVRGGSMGKLLEKWGPLSDCQDHLASYINDVLQAVTYLHGKTMAHRDIKPENLLVNQLNGRIKLADFNTCKHQSELSAGRRTHVGTSYYMAPETDGGSAGGRHADIWSVGCTILVLALGKSNGFLTIENIRAELTRSGQDGIKALLRASHTLKEPDEAATVALTEPMVQLVSKCLRGDADSRPEAKDLIGTAKALRKCHSEDVGAAAARVYSDDDIGTLFAQLFDATLARADILFSWKQVVESSDVFESAGMAEKSGVGLVLDRLLDVIKCQLFVKHLSERDADKADGKQKNLTAAWEKLSESENGLSLVVARNVLADVTCGRGALRAIAIKAARKHHQPPPHTIFTMESVLDAAFDTVSAALKASGAVGLLDSEPSTPASMAMRDEYAAWGSSISSTD